MSRSDPKGMVVQFEVSGPSRVTHLAVGVLDGEDNDTQGFTLDAGKDGRSIRSLSFKPGVNGAWPFFVEATDARGCTVRQAGPETVIVVSKQ